MIICIFARWLCSVVSMDCSRKYIQCAMNTFTILTRLPFIWWENQLNMKVGMWKCVSTIKGTRTNHRVICTSSVYAYSIHTVYTYSTSSMTHETHFCHSNVFLSNIQKMLPKTGKIKKKKKETLHLICMIVTASDWFHHPNFNQFHISCKLSHGNMHDFAIVRLLICG